MSSKGEPTGSRFRTIKIEGSVARGHLHFLRAPGASRDAWEGILKWQLDNATGLATSSRSCRPEEHRAG